MAEKGAQGPARSGPFRRNDVKDCPDLAAMTSQQRSEFWSHSDPRELRRLGDRLLAESLPREQHSCAREALSLAAAQRRELGGWSRATVAKVLGVTESLVEAWETDKVKTPDSLPLILERMASLEVSQE